MNDSDTIKVGDFVRGFAMTLIVRVTQVFDDAPFVIGEDAFGKTQCVQEPVRIGGVKEVVKEIEECNLERQAVAIIRSKRWPDVGEHVREMVAQAQLDDAEDESDAEDLSNGN